MPFPSLRKKQPPPPFEQEPLHSNITHANPHAKNANPHAPHANPYAKNVKPRSKKEYNFPSIEPPARTEQTLAFQKQVIPVRTPSSGEEQLLNQWKANATYDKLGEYSTYLWSCELSRTCSRTFISEARRFLAPYLLAQNALTDYSTSLNDPKFFVNKYGPYSYKRNDCYTFALKLISQYLYPPSEREKVRLRDRSLQKFDATGQDWSSDVPAPGFYVACLHVKSKNLRSGKLTVHLQVGDLIKSQYSKYGTGSNHWGMLVNIGGQPYVVERSDTVHCISLDEFMKENSKGEIEIRRPYGYSGYAQHFEVNVMRVDYSVGKRSKRYSLHYTCSLVNSPEPADMMPTWPSVAKK